MGTTTTTDGTIPCVGSSHSWPLGSRDRRERGRHGRWIGSMVLHFDGVASSGPSQPRVVYLLDADGGGGGGGGGGGVNVKPL